MTNFFSLKKFCDGILTEISQNIVTKIVSVTKYLVMKKMFVSQNCDGVCDGFVTVICHNFVTKIVFDTKFSSWKCIFVKKL